MHYIDLKRFTTRGAWLLNFFKDYSSMISEAKFKATHGVELKIITPKQMLQRMTTALAQVKADNTSENVLNEIHHKIYYL